MENLCDELLEEIFTYWISTNLLCLLRAASVCRRWNKIIGKVWRTRVTRLKFRSFFTDSYYPKGRLLNKGLRWALRRCGRQLKTLDLWDPDPEPHVIRVNERTFKIIGRYCRNIDDLSLRGLLLLNEHLEFVVRYMNCVKIRRVDLKNSFSHYCVVSSGLLTLYQGCPNIESLDLSESLNARLRDIHEPWPPTLREVYLDNDTGITGYSLLTLVRCCPQLRVFSMCTRGGGMNDGVQYVLTHCEHLERLWLRYYPGTTALGMQIGCLQMLKEIRLSYGSMVNDEVVGAIASSCRGLEVFELNSRGDVTYFTAPKEIEPTLTDVGLRQIARYLPNLRELYLDKHRFFTDDGITEIIANGRLETLSLAESVTLTEMTLDVLALNCARLEYLDISNWTNCFQTSSLARLCASWLDTGERSRLDLWASDMPIEFRCLYREFDTVCGSTLEFTRRSVVPRKIIQLYSDLAQAMFEKFS